MSEKKNIQADNLVVHTYMYALHNIKDNIIKNLNLILISLRVIYFYIVKGQNLKFYRNSLL